MNIGLYIAASGMIAEQTREDQLSNDLANANTPGYKPDESSQTSFDSILQRSTQVPTSNDGFTTGGSTIGSLYAGVAIDKTTTDLTPAPLDQTGNPLDFGIAGTGFFAVKTSQGVQYTRNGQFTVSAQNELVDQDGDPVLTQSGAPVKVAAGATVSPSQIGVFAVNNAQKLGNNNFSGTASGRGEGTTQQGSLESSGVNPTTVTVDMISSLRDYQSGQQAIQAIEQTMALASSQVGSMNGQ